MNQPKDFRMNPINLVLTVCAVLSPTTCEEQRLVLSWNGSLAQCAMAAPPYVAQWVGEHPKWTAVKWRCEYQHGNHKAATGGATPAG
jgi:hypothetical protein